VPTHELIIEEVNQALIETKVPPSCGTSIVNKVLKISDMLRDVHQQHLNSQENLKIKAKIESLKISLVLAKHALEEMEVS